MVVARFAPFAHRPAPPRPCAVGADRLAKASDGETLRSLRAAGVNAATVIAGLDAAAAS